MTASLRTRYIDLLVKCVLGMIYGDGPGYDEADRLGGMDWPVNGHSMIGWRRMSNLRQLTEAVIAEAIPGDLIETGVWRGGACIVMRGILAAYGLTDRSVIVADSFQGLPEANVAAFPADAGLHLHTEEYLKVSVEAVRANFETYGLLDHQVLFLEGWFKDTLGSLAGRRFSLIRLDGDYYESTIQALQALYPLLSDGGFCIIDDYGVFQACQQAVSDYRAEHKIVEPIQVIDGCGRWWRKRGR